MSRVSPEGFCILYVFALSLLQQTWTIWFNSRTSAELSPAVEEIEPFGSAVIWRQLKITGRLPLWTRAGHPSISAAIWTKRPAADLIGFLPVFFFFHFHHSYLFFQNNFSLVQSERQINVSQMHKTSLAALERDWFGQFGFAWDLVVVLFNNTTDRVISDGGGHPHTRVSCWTKNFSSHGKHFQPPVLIQPWNSGAFSFYFLAFT